MKTMVLVGEIKDFPEQKIYTLSGQCAGLLLIHHNNHYYMVENKCGHFGIPLADASVQGEEIICSGHGISFSMVSGEIVNRPFENCDAIKTYPVMIKNQEIYYDPE